MGRRGSREEHDGQQYMDQRRRSADPAMIMTFDHQTAYRSANTQHGAYKTPAELPSNKEKRSSRPQFQDTGSDEGSSQSCEVLMPAGITFTLEETVDDIKSASSTSTLVENGSNGSQPRQPLEIVTSQKALSQEIFGEDERHEIGMLSTVCEGKLLSPQHLYYDSAFSQTLHHYGLSQPSPPKSRHGKSLTDITSASAAAMNIGGGSNLLALRQCLSQSVDCELSHFTQPGQPRYAAESQPRHARLMTAVPVKHSQSVSQSQIHRMASDSHLNYEGPPGQKNSMLSALNRARGEIEQKKQQPRQRSGPNHTRKQFKSHHLQKKHVQATVVTQTARSNKTNSLDKRYMIVFRHHVMCSKIIIVLTSFYDVIFNF